MKCLVLFAVIILSIMAWNELTYDGPVNYGAPFWPTSGVWFFAGPLLVVAAIGAIGLCSLFAVALVKLLKLLK